MGDRFDRSLGEELALLRRTRNLTINQIAEATGVPRPDIESYEAGACIPPERLENLCRAMDCTVAGLRNRALDGEVEEQSSLPTTAEGLRLMGYFRRVLDPRLRRQLIETARTMADLDPPPPIDPCP